MFSYLFIFRNSSLTYYDSYWENLEVSKISYFLTFCHRRKLWFSKAHSSSSYINILCIFFQLPFLFHQTKLIWRTREKHEAWEVQNCVAACGMWMLCCLKHSCSQPRAELLLPVLTFYYNVSNLLFISTRWMALRTHPSFRKLTWDAGM